MANILIVYSTVDGHTREICQRLQSVMEREHHRVCLLAINESVKASLAQFDTIVIGASIRYGKHRPELIDFINRNEQLLERKFSALFSVNVVARKEGKNRPETNPYMQKLLRNISWKPKHLAVFAGKIDYPRYRFFDRLMIRFIMWVTNGPTERNAVVDFTDWKQVEEFGLRLSGLSGK